jgi:hypothetical protein
MRTPAAGLNLSQKIVVAGMDLLMLVELAVAMYLAGRNPETLTPVFLKSFAGMLLPTLVAGLLAIRALRRPTLGGAP